jgi:hypothetical protein
MNCEMESHDGSCQNRSHIIAMTAKALTCTVMHVELLGDLLDCFDAFEGLQRHSGFELWVVSFTFGFHLVLGRFSKRLSKKALYFLESW